MTVLLVLSGRNLHMVIGHPDIVEQMEGDPKHD